MNRNTILFVGHEAGIGGYGVQDSGKIVFRGTLQECRREIIRRGVPTPLAALRARGALAAANGNTITEEV